MSKSQVARAVIDLADVAKNELKVTLMQQNTEQNLELTQKQMENINFIFEGVVSKVFTQKIDSVTRHIKN
jgi:hypothetical protein